MKLWPAHYRPAMRQRPAAAVIAFVSRQMDVTAESIRGANRVRACVDARHMLCVVFRERGLSTPVIGRLVGDRDHSTVLHACRTFPARAERSPELTSILNATRIFAAGGGADIKGTHHG